jgi:putative phosphoesterase
MLTLGIISDTHIPDRARKIHPEALSIFRNAQVEAILHAGDASIPGVYDTLRELAPVHTVQGNRDLFSFFKIPQQSILKFEEIKIGLTHGHAGWDKYIKDRIARIFFGPHSFQFHLQRTLDSLPEDLDVIVFGHIHTPMNYWHNGKLIFNPGSACCPNEHYPHLNPSIGLLYITGNKVTAEIVYLKKMKL